jgi:hypothetical protein
MGRLAVSWDGLTPPYATNANVQCAGGGMWAPFKDALSNAPCGWTGERHVAWNDWSAEPCERCNGWVVSIPWRLIDATA